MSWARLKPVPLSVKIFLLGFAVLVYVLFAAHYESPSSLPKLQVRYETKDFILSTGCAVSKILTDLGVDHALCYESLVGALKYGRMLQTQSRMDFCVLEAAVAGGTGELRRILSQRNLSVEYNVWRGELFVSLRTQPSYPVVVITLFQRQWTSRRKIARVGLQRWLLSFFTDDRLDAFPENLIEGPLKNLTYEGIQMPVPHEDGKMLKYLYPDSWWKETS